MIRVSWKHETEGAPVTTEWGIVVGWVHNGTTCAVVMIRKSFVTIAAHLLTFEDWRG